MSKAKLLPLALLYAADDQVVDGITRLQKLVFLAQEESEIESEYEFYAYDYGPYSKELYDALDTLEDRELIEKEVESTRSGNEKYIYSLTDKGRTLVIDYLDFSDDRDSVLTVADTITEEYNDMPIQRLLQYVYKEYPDSTERTKLSI